MVETGVLLHKIKECGVSGRVGCRLSAFLELLFFINIRDIADIHSQGKTATSHADDTRVQSKVKSAVDCSVLQVDLEFIYQ